LKHFELHADLDLHDWTGNILKCPEPDLCLDSSLRECTVELL